MKKLGIILGSIALLILLFMAGCRALIYTIGNSNTCEQFNIDNIELRTGIDIPATTNVDCIYNDGIKDVVFTLDTNEVVIPEYLSRNKFEQSGGKFVNNGEKKRTKWEATYDKKRAELTMHLVYKDVKEKS